MKAGVGVGFPQRKWSVVSEETGMEFGWIYSFDVHHIHTHDMILYDREKIRKETLVFGFHEGGAMSLPEQFTQTQG